MFNDNPAENSSGVSGDFDPNKTQPTWAVRLESQPTQTPNVQAKVEDKKATSEPQNPKFGWGSFFSLLGLIWIAEGFGSAFPGPIDDILWDLIAALFFGLVQYLRLKLPLLDQFLRLQGVKIWQKIGKKYPKLANSLLFYFGKENQFNEDE